MANKKSPKEKNFDLRLHNLIHTPQVEELENTVVHYAVEVLHIPATSLNQHLIWTIFADWMERRIQKMLSHDRGTE